MFLPVLRTEAGEPQTGFHEKHFITLSLLDYQENHTTGCSAGRFCSDIRRQCHISTGVMPVCAETWTVILRFVRAAAGTKARSGFRLRLYAARSDFRTLSIASRTNVQLQHCCSRLFCRTADNIDRNPKAKAVKAVCRAPRNAARRTHLLTFVIERAAASHPICARRRTGRICE